MNYSIRWEYLSVVHWLFADSAITAVATYYALRASGVANRVEIWQGARKISPETLAQIIRPNSHKPV